MKMLRLTSAGWSAHLLLGSVFYFLLSPSAFPQGSLTPPGAPTPTMKRLDEVEPRANLQATPAPAGVDTTNANYQFIITQPGSYYLSANLGVTKNNGIQINAEGVTFDLNGFQISRANGGFTGNGIEITVTSHRASIRNGSIVGFAIGVFSHFSGGYARACAFRDLAVSNCTTYGIFAEAGAVLETCRTYSIGPGASAGISTDVGSSLANCTAYNITGTYGIIARDGCSLTNCSASNNNATYGIYAGSGASLINCAASNNGGTYSIYALGGSSLTNCSASNNTATYGIYAEPGSSLTNCSALNNTGSAASSAGIATTGGCTFAHCTANNNVSTATASATTGMGFYLGSQSTVQGCTAANNKGDGINISNSSVVRDDACDSNGLATGDGAGIHATGNHNRIEGNNVTNNDRGIQVTGAGNILLKNTARNNGTSSAGNYVIAADNHYGPIVDATAANAIAPSGKGPFASSLNDANGGTHPWANFSY